MCFVADTCLCVCVCACLCSFVCAVDGVCDVLWMLCVLCLWFVRGVCMRDVFVAVCLRDCGFLCGCVCICVVSVCLLVCVSRVCIADVIACM